MILAIISAVLGLAMAWQVGAGVRHAWCHERAKRRAAKFVFPPQTVIAVHLGDDIPW